MSLEKKDVRMKLHPDMHAQLTVLAEVSRMEIGEFVESVLVGEINRRVHEASVIADRLSRLGLTGNRRAK
jgi:hypothetical protein